MTQYGWRIDISKCTQCRACINACKFENNTTLDFNVNYRWIIFQEAGTYPDVKRTFFTLSCNHCQDPACLASCPVDAITKRSDGIVLIDQDKCIGCRYCVWACPYGVPQFNEETQKVEKCTLCVHRIDAGLEPACVAACVGRSLAIDFDVDTGSDTPRDFADRSLTNPQVEFLWNGAKLKSF